MMLLVASSTSVTLEVRLRRHHLRELLRAFMHNPGASTSNADLVFHCQYHFLSMTQSHTNRTP